MKRLSGIPLRWQLTGFFLLMIGSLLLGFGLILYRQIDGFLTTNTEDRVHRQVQAIVARESARPAPAKGKVAPAADDLQKVAAALVRELSGQDVYVQVVTHAGTTITNSDSAAVGSVPQASPSTLASANAGHPASETVAAFGGTALLILEPIAGESGQAGVALVTVDMGPAAELLGRLRMVLAIGGGVTLLVGAVAGVSVTRRLLRPLEDVARTADEIARAGDLSLRAGALGGSPEIRRLARSFDEMVDRLTTSIAAQRRFVADASHELKTPLSAATGMLDVILLGAYDGDPGRRDRAIHTATESLGRVNALVDQLLSLSLLDADAPVRLERVDLGLLVSRVLADERALCAGHTIYRTLAPGIFVRGDSVRLRQVFLNLLENASKFSPGGGAIEWVVGATDDRAFVTVKDEGAGISAAALPHVFERFYRADEARARNGAGGTGLGLAISRATLEALGGGISAESAGPGLGSIFRVWLPLHDERTGPGGAPAAGGG